MTRLLLAATASALVLAACSQDVETEAPETPEASAESAPASAPAIDGPSLDEILAIEDILERREALLERGNAIFQEREALQGELEQVAGALEVIEGELAAQAFLTAGPAVEDARMCEGGNPDGPEFNPPTIGEGLTPAATNEIIGAAYLAAADAAPCVYRLDSGLRFRIDVANPEGQSPENGETVLVHYEGTLPDGSVFDSSYERGEPAAFPSDRLIAGWVEALSHMNTGETWTLMIPSELAYGERGAGDDIGPNATLRFKVELIALPLRAEPLGEAEDTDG